MKTKSIVTYALLVSSFLWVASGCSGDADDALSDPPSQDKTGDPADPNSGSQNGGNSNSGSQNEGGSNGTPPNGGGGMLPSDVEPRALGVPVPPDLVGLVRDEELGPPKMTNTILDDDGLIGIWLPPGVERIRGIHINLLANPLRGGSLVRSRLDRQVASTWQFAQVGGWNVWQKDRSSSEEGWAAIDAFLNRVADDTGHPELKTAPVVITGGSRTGRWGTTIANLIPERMIGYVTVVASAAPDKARTPVLYATPGLLVPGEKDKGSRIVSGMEELRSEGARVAVAMNWGQGHTCGPCERIIYPFLDSVIRARIKDGEVVDANEDAAWLGHHGDWSAYPASDFPHDSSTASWLIDPHFANVWRAFTLKEPQGDFTGPKLVEKSNELSDTRAADLDRITARVSGISGTVQLYDGATQVSEATLDGEGNVAFEGLELAPGMHYFIIMQDGLPLSHPSLVLLLE